RQPSPSPASRLVSPCAGSHHRPRRSATPAGQAVDNNRGCGQAFAPIDPTRRRCTGVVAPVRQDVAVSIESIDALVSAALQLGADQVRGWSERERALAAATPRLPVPVGSLRDRIRAGEDPLGEAFGQLRSAERRRALGQTYTPAP